MNDENNTNEPTSEPYSVPEPQPESAPEPLLEPTPDATQTDAVPTPPAPAPAPKKNKKLLIILLAAALVLIAAGVVVYFLFFRPTPQDAAQNTQDTPAVTETPPATPTDTTDHAQNFVDKITTSLTDEFGAAYTALETDESTSAPAYKVPDTTYYILNGDFGKSFSVTAGYETTLSGQIESHMNEVLSSDTSLKKTSTEWRVTYQSDEVICEILGGGNPLYLSCANIRDYASRIAQIKPFADAYLASEDGKLYGDGIGFGLVSVTEKGGGYKSAQVGMGSGESPVGGFMGLYYAKNNNWFYFTGTQSVMACSDYNTYDIQKAFEGDICYDDTTPDQTESTVRVTSE